MTLDPMRVLPDPDPTTEFYWQAALRRELHIARCRACGFYVHPPKTSCPRCGSSDVVPERVSGRGTVHSYTVSYHPASGLPVPFVLALIELEEQAGLRVLANLLDCPREEVRVGLEVVVVFEEVEEGIVLPQFRPRR